MKLNDYYIQNLQFLKRKKRKQLVYRKYIYKKKKKKKKSSIKDEKKENYIYFLYRGNVCASERRNRRVSQQSVDWKARRTTIPNIYMYIYIYEIFQESQITKLFVFLSSFKLLACTYIQYIYIFVYNSLSSSIQFFCLY